MDPASTSKAPEWVQAPTPDSVDGLTSHGLAPRLAALLARRGIETFDDANRFLEPSLAGLHDPLSMPGLREGVDRLLEARRENQKVAIVGDYDVDGISATALLMAVFRACGLDAAPILPERLKEGYGFQPVHVDTAIQLGCELVVTADCGSTAVEAVEAAREANLGVIVTDHHLGAEVRLPDWVIEINPHRPDSSYPFPELSGAGVAYKLAVGLLEAVGKKFDADALLRITCLGTICDLVPLVGENRVIAARGLEALGETRSVGLRSLMRRASVKPPVTATDVGYRIGPRINAAGRLASPRPALDLLLTSDRSEAARLADQLDSWNRERQGTERSVVDAAEKMFSDLEILPPVLVGWSEDWHPGVLGIAAGRIARTFYRPTVLLSVTGESAKGSGRSVSGIHFFDFLGEWKMEYKRFGGHAQAIGITVATDDLETLRGQWQSKAAEHWDPSLLIRSYEYELSLTPGEINNELLEQLERMEPFGMANRQPLLRVGPLNLSGSLRHFGRGHLSTKAVGGGGELVELLGWGWQERETDLQGDFEILGNLERDRYHGGPVLRLLDAHSLEPDSSIR